MRHARRRAPARGGGGCLIMLMKAWFLIFVLPGLVLLAWVLWRVR